MLDGSLTTTRRCATSVSGCSGRQAPGQRQWRVGSSKDPLYKFPLTPRRRDSLISVRAAAHGSSGPLPRCCARLCGREGQPHHFCPHLIGSSSPGDCRCLWLVSLAVFLKRDAFSVDWTRMEGDPVSFGSLERKNKAHDQFIILYPALSGNSIILPP